MPLTKEAARLYLFSKRVLELNKKLKKLGKSAEKHKGRHEKAAMHKKGKHRARHASTVKDIREVMKKHNEALSRLKTHYHRFAHYLRKEHKV
ncbi:hypothetical protein GOV03_02040 [Candidatus Woesearchaeota archaeon]|nr:hypothetical protein [Candidatus Woesearchaeota archaeon]